MSEHGTRSRYVAGCRCESCTKANRDYARNRYSAKLKEERGEAIHNWQQTESAKTLITGLIVRGYGISEIARLTGINKTTICAIYYDKSYKHTGGRRYVKAETVEKLRAMMDAPSHAYAPHQLVDGTKTRAVVEFLVERYGRMTAAQLLRWDLRRLDNFRSHPSNKVRYETSRSVMDFLELAYRANEKRMKPKTWEELKKEREAAGFVVNPYE